MKGAGDCMRMRNRIRAKDPADKEIFSRDSSRYGAIEMSRIAARQ